MSRNVVFLLLLPFLFGLQGNNQDEIKLYEDTEAYNVYSAVLALGQSKGELLIGDTTFHSINARSGVLTGSSTQPLKVISKPIGADGGWDTTLQSASPTNCFWPKRPSRCLG